tara:strand:+ start:29469 stop:31043 length:1575 start_codon:yes stop_codon:yes gene_type:complete
MKAVFRVDASIEIGSGHVMRCLSLANVLKNNSFMVEFICRNHDGNLINRIVEDGFRVHEIELAAENKTDDKLEHSAWLGTSQKQDADDTIKVIKNDFVDWIVVDSYSLDEDWHKSVKPYCKKLMVIDDLADRKYHCDILIDQTFGRENKDYFDRIPSYCQALLGSKYALLRPEFFDLREKSLAKRNHHELQHLLINMGGIDAANITEKILDHLKTCKLDKELKITVVMGENAPHLELVREKAKELKQKTNVLVNVKNMAQIMTSADIAIGASGSASWERCCLGLPTIQIAISKNQEYLSFNLASKNIIKLINDINEISHLLENSKKWMNEVRSLSAEICDGLGTSRVFNKMTDETLLIRGFDEIELCNYTNLDQKNINLALEMRNHKDIRSWMYNQNHISIEEHLSFIEMLQTETKTRYFLVKQSGLVIGAINFLKIQYGNSVDFGIYKNPFLKSKGLGKIIEAAASEYAFTELAVRNINLEVIAANIKAINFYKRCGFETINKSIINNQKIICMSKENNSIVI